MNKLLFLILVTVLNCTVQANDTALEAKISYASKKNICIELLIKNTSNEDFYIEDIKGAYMPFEIRDKFGETYQYKAPSTVVVPRRLYIDNYVFLRKNSAYKKIFCFYDYLTLESGVRNIKYIDIIPLYKFSKEEGRMVSLRRYEDVLSNVLTFD